MALPSVGLIRKLIGVLEALEKLPVYTHEPPGQMLNLQSIQKRIRFALERAPGATDLRDCAGRTLRAEPLASVDGLEKFLNGIVSSLWLLHVTVSNVVILHQWRCVVVGSDNWEGEAYVYSVV